VTDRFTLDILREAFLAVADEMFVSLQRTSQSPIVYEVLDFGVGLTNPVGELVSQGNGVAGFLGPLGDAVVATLEEVPDLVPGDVVVANDPYKGGGTHLSDVAMVRPIFVDGELIGFATAKAHWTDVGGRDPGSWSSSTTSVYQEGLQLPYVRAWKAGVLDVDIARMIMINSRLPEQALGDLTAQAACLEVADRRVQELCARYGSASVVEAMREVLNRSERLARATLRDLPHGVFEAVDWADKDGVGNGPFEVRVRVTIDDDGVHCDFTGSHPQVPGPINCTWSGLVSGVRTVFKAITDPQEPASDGWFRPLTITCPPGTLFTAQRPAPVAAYFESSEIASDLVWQALARACPDRLSAGHFLSVCSTSLSCRHPDTGEDALLVEPHAGGWGASESSDGQNGVVSVGDGETYIIPVEVAEQRYGIRVERFALNIQPDAGAGRQRGGYGLIREYRILSDEAIFTVAMGRHDALPWGVDGGEGGSPNYVEIHYASGDVSDRFGKGTALPLVRGDLIRIVTGTGGGWGPPGERDEALMRRDQQNGYV
jgi:N-methylhydantoinase B